MQFVPMEPGIDVKGEALNSLVAAFAAIRKIPSEVFLNLGVCRTSTDGIVTFDPEEWLSQAAVLETYRTLSQGVGAGALFFVGQKLSETGVFPPWITDVHAAMKSLDVVYHSNHRKEGRVMFDPVTGIMLEGIGHYGYAPVFGENRILCRCENPYPCDFDRGILTALARRFASKVFVEHEDPDVCRKKGAEHCTYSVMWHG